MLPTAKNRSTESVARDVAQCVYFDVFSTYARHKIPNAEEFDEIKEAVKSVETNVTSQHFGSTNRVSQLNSEVSSWNIKRQIFPSSSTIFNESIGEDGLPLNLHMMSDLIILIILNPLLQIQKYCVTHYQSMKI